MCDLKQEISRRRRRHHHHHHHHHHHCTSTASYDKDIYKFCFEKSKP
jgi:hypothetical protein